MMHCSCVVKAVFLGNSDEICREGKICKSDFYRCGERVQRTSPRNDLRVRLDVEKAHVV